MRELSVGETYFQYLHVDVDIFEELYALVEPDQVANLLAIAKKSCELFAN